MKTLVDRVKVIAVAEKSNVKLSSHDQPVCEVLCAFQLGGTSYSTKSGGQTDGR